MPIVAERQKKHERLVMELPIHFVGNYAVAELDGMLNFQKLFLNDLH